VNKLPQNAVSTEISTETVAEIGREHELPQSAFRAAIGHAIRCGELLIDAKAQVRHGEWSSWLAEHFAGSERTARGYMRLARNRQRVADMPSIREALAELAEHREAPTDESLDEAALRRVQHEDVEEDLRRVFVAGGWRREPWSWDALIAWTVIGVTMRGLDDAGAPADFGYADLDEYVAERLPDVENVWRGLEFEMAFQRERTA